MSVVAHFDKDGNSITKSAICHRCEGDAGKRIKSWMIAQENPNFDGESREESPNLICAFCGRK